MNKTTEKITLEQDGKVKVSYIEPALDIKNKKGKVIGRRDITYDAEYDNIEIAVKMFREKITEHKNGIKKLKEFNKEHDGAITDLKEQQAMNHTSIEALTTLISKSETIMNKIKDLK